MLHTLRMRIVTLCVLALAMLGCAPPEGRLVSIAGGLGGSQIEVFRDAPRSWFYRRSSARTGVEVEVDVTVTFAGLREYEDAQAEVPEDLEGQLSSCLEIDGQDAKVFLEHDDDHDRFVSFCAHNPPPEVERLARFWSAAIDAFEECKKTASFRLSC
jgi:hypothetical protein